MLPTSAMRGRQDSDNPIVAGQLVPGQGDKCAEQGDCHGAMSKVLVD